MIAGFLVKRSIQFDINQSKSPNSINPSKWSTWLLLLLMLMLLLLRFILGLSLIIVLSTISSQIQLFIFITFFARQIESNVHNELKEKKNRIKKNHEAWSACECSSVFFFLSPNHLQSMALDVKWWTFSQHCFFFVSFCFVFFLFDTIEISTIREK